MKHKIVFSVLTALFLVSCNFQPKYASMDEYPVYEGDDLGAIYTPSRTSFRTWSPAAEAVRLHIYADAQGGEPLSTYDMRRSEQGSWRYNVQQNLAGKFYTFQVKQNGQWYDETPGIWAKAVGVNGHRGAIIDLAATNPDGWESDVRPAMKHFTDAVIYEVHMRDFSIDSTSGSHFPGKFLALTESGIKSPQGEKTGLDHLKELGVTHVQILPSYDYASIDETQLDSNRYNWGYDPENYNVPEGGYSTNPYDPAARIREMKQMIQTLHANGIRVIMDVVYNHTFVGENSHLNLLVPGYFYRMNADSTWSNASGCGNETASERPMMRHFMVESAKYWATEYHIDGFRFDLMGIHDIETMNAIRTALDQIDPSISIHGEGWAAGGSPLDENVRALKQNAPQFYPTAVFSDDIRDAMRGNWMDGNNGGFLVGNGYEESIKFGIVGATAHPQVDVSKVVHTNTAYATTPAQAINYVSCHDDPCLKDKLRATIPNIGERELLKMDKLAQTIVLTSQGVPFIFAGEEIFRDKKGVHNSYQSPDSINAIDWSRKAKYRDLFDYYKRLIALRAAHPAFRMTSAEQVAKHLTFDEKTGKNVVAYTLNNHANGDAWGTILVVFNGNRKPTTYKLPVGTWTAVCRDGKIDENGRGRCSGTIKIGASEAVILYQ